MATPLRFRYISQRVDSLTDMVGDLYADITAMLPDLRPGEQPVAADVLAKIDEAHGLMLKAANMVAKAR